MQFRTHCETCSKNLLVAAFLTLGNLDGITRRKHTIHVDQDKLIIFVEVMLAWASSSMGKLQEIAEIPLVGDLAQQVTAIDGQGQAMAAGANYYAALYGRDVSEDFITNLGNEMISGLNERKGQIMEMDAAWDREDAES